jgi:hypothetical protein
MSSLREHRYALTVRRHERETAMGVLLLAVAATGLLSGPLQDQAQRTPGAAPDCSQPQGRQGEPVCPGPSQPIPIPYPPSGLITHPTVRPGIRASNGDEAGNARREIAPPAGPSSPQQGSALTGRPVGQPAAAGLGSHVQREATPPPEAPAPPGRSPN